MKMKLFLLSLPMVLIGCTAKPKPESPKPPKPKALLESSASPKSTVTNDTIHLREGQAIFLDDKQMNIRFLRVVQDSRCPANAKCISAGNATVELECMSTTSRPYKLQLSTGDLRNGLKNTEDFENYTLTLFRLDPKLDAKNTSQNLSGSYTIYLSIR